MSSKYTYCLGQTIDSLLSSELTRLQGVDIVPLQIDENLPDNCHFAFEDCSGKLGYPDEHFDAVHSRLMVAGVRCSSGPACLVQAAQCSSLADDGQIRDWPAYIAEIVRITKPGGLIVFVEAAGDFGLDSPPKDPKLNERGFALWASFVSK